VLDVVVTQTGYRGTKLPLIVEEGGRIISQQDVTLAGDGEAQTVKVRFKAGDVGPRVFRFRVPVQRRRGSHAEQPARRAHRRLQPPREDSLSRGRAAGSSPSSSVRRPDLDDNLQVVLLQRTAQATVSAPDKFLRIRRRQRPRAQSTASR
jgi:hypothetical protein